MHRSDGSGTTYIFTDYLSKVSPEWKEQGRAGHLGRVARRAGRQGQRGRHPAGQAVRGRHRLRRADLRACPTAFPRPTIRNAAGAFVAPTLKSVTAAAASAELRADTDFRVSITNAPGADAYPIASFTWLLVHSGGSATAPRTRPFALPRLDAGARRRSAWRPTSTTRPLPVTADRADPAKRPRGLVTDPLHSRDEPPGGAGLDSRHDRPHRARRRAGGSRPRPAVARAQQLQRPGLQGPADAGGPRHPRAPRASWSSSCGRGPGWRSAKFGFDFVTTSVWDPVAEQFGAFPLIFGTLRLLAHRAGDRRAALARRRDLPHRVRAQGRPPAGRLPHQPARRDPERRLRALGHLRPDPAAPEDASSRSSGTCSASCRSSRARSTARRCSPPASSSRS